jgi:hypothetical protein
MHERIASAEPHRRWLLGTSRGFRLGSVPRGREFEIGCEPRLRFGNRGGESLQSRDRRQDDLLVLRLESCDADFDGVQPLRRTVDGSTDFASG